MWLFRCNGIYEQYYGLSMDPEETAKFEGPFVTGRLR